MQNHLKMIIAGSTTAVVIIKSDAESALSAAPKLLHKECPIMRSLRLSADDSALRKMDAI